MSQTHYRYPWHQICLKHLLSHLQHEDKYHKTTNWNINKETAYLLRQKCMMGKKIMVVTFHLCEDIVQSLTKVHNILIITWCRRNTKQSESQTMCMHKTKKSIKWHSLWNPTLLFYTKMEMISSGEQLYVLTVPCTVSSFFSLFSFTQNQKT